jgi:hypothetical protein
MDTFLSECNGLLICLRKKIREVFFVQLHELVLDHLLFLKQAVVEAGIDLPFAIRKIDVPFP